jgi:hypothetical protein
MEDVRASIPTDHEEVIPVLLKDRKTRPMQGSTQAAPGTRPDIDAAPRTNRLGWIVAALVIVAVTVAILVMTRGGDGGEGAGETAPVGSTDTTGEPTGESVEPLFTPEELRQMESIEQQRFQTQAQ